MKVIIDTNVLVSALSAKSIYHWLIQQIIDEKLEIFITTEILLEYEEVLTQKYAQLVANSFIAALKELPNVYFTHIYYRWKLLLDQDDNKFVDCAIAATADYIVTNDRDFDVLKKIAFPKVAIITIQEFKIVIDAK